MASETGIGAVEDNEDALILTLIKVSPYPLPYEPKTFQLAVWGNKLVGETSKRRLCGGRFHPELV